MENKQLKATGWFLMLTLGLFLWCEFPGCVKMQRKQEGEFFNIYADVSQSFWADIFIMEEGILWNNLFHFNVN